MRIRTGAFFEDPIASIAASVLGGSGASERDVTGEKVDQNRVVLTLVPHSQYCPAQAYELANALGIEILVPPDAGFTTIDGGGHLDRKGAIKFTNFLMTELVKTDAYLKSFNEDRR